LTVKLTRRHHRPTLLVDLAKVHHYQIVRDWLIKQNIRVLNVAGPRESSADEITMEAEQFLTNCLTVIDDQDCG